MENLILFIFFPWLFIITYLFIKIKVRYSKLISTTNRTNLDDILNLIIEKTTNTEKEVNNLKRIIDSEVKKSKFYIKNIGLIRYNPFEKDLGKESFVISLLNDDKSGIILNFMYTKDGLRVFSKIIKKSKSEDYNLSEEEVKAIQESY